MLGEYSSPRELAARPLLLRYRNFFIKAKEYILKKNDPILIQRIANELLESGAVEQAFARNNEALTGCVWPKGRSSFNHGYDWDMVNESFLWGLYMEFLEGQPPLPTEPRYRLMTYMIDYLARYYDEPVFVTRQQVFKVKSAFNAADPLTKEIIRIGRLAFCDSDNWHLNTCHRLAATWKT